MKIGEKVKVNKDIPSVNGILREGTKVKIDNITIHEPYEIVVRVKDNLGKIWHLGEDDING